MFFITSRRGLCSYIMGVKKISVPGGGRGDFRYLAGEDYSQVRFQMAKRSPFFSAAEGQLFTISMVQSPLTLKAWL